MGFHKRGDEESSVQEDSCGKTIFACRSAPVCQLEIEIKRELESHNAEGKMTSCTHTQFVSRMYKEIHEMTGAKLLSVKTMVTN